MPGISDPGKRWLRDALQLALNTPCCPGKRAAYGAGNERAAHKERLLRGLLPREGKPRREAIAEIGAHKGTLIFYESPLRIAATAKELAAMLGDRQCALVRELTKKFEQVVRCTLSGLADMYADTPPKGECVMVVAGAAEQGENAAERAEDMARELIERGVSVKDAAKQISALCDIARNEAYAIAGRIKNEE